MAYRHSCIQKISVYLGLTRKKDMYFFPVNPKQQISSHVLKNISNFTRDIADIFNIFDDIHVFGIYLKM